MQISLRPYQSEALIALTEAAKRVDDYFNKHGSRADVFSAEPCERRLLCIQPTGAGKTVLVLSFAAEVFRRFGWRTLLVVPSRELLAQTIRRAAEFFPDLRVSRIGDGSFDQSGDLVVATGASLVGDKLKQVSADSFALVICDEAHHAAARSYAEMLAHFSSARLHVGLTATHVRGDGESIASANYFPCVAVWNTISQLTHAGFLVPAFGFYVYTETSLENLKIKNGDFVERELSKTVNNPPRNRLAVDAYLQHLRGRQTICFAVDVAHARCLADCFNEREVAAAAVWGAMKPEEYRSIMQKFYAGEISVLVNAKLLVEGWDCPQTSGVLIARPTTKTSAAVLGPQMIGRALRPSRETGKTDAVIVELRDRPRNEDGARAESRSTSLLETMAETNENDFSSVVALHEQADFNRALTSWEEREKLRRSLFDDCEAVASFDVIEKVCEASAYSWVLLGKILYLPLVEGEFLEVVETAATCFEVRGWIAGELQQIGYAATRERALRIADSWLEQNACRRHLILRDQPWRARPASEKQILLAAELTGLTVSFLLRRTAGQISDLIRSAYALSLTPEEIVVARSNLSVVATEDATFPHSWQIRSELDRQNG